MKIGSIRKRSIVNISFRIDPSYHLSDAVRQRSSLNKSPYSMVAVKDCSEEIFYGNIFSRIFVDNPHKGVPYLAASDSVLADLDTGRFLAKHQAESLSHLYLKKDWILITCSGTIGKTVYTNKTYENHLATHDLIRVIPNNCKIKKGVLYSFLKTHYGQNLLTQSRFGAVIKHINVEHVGSITIPQFPDSVQNEVDSLVAEAANLREQATSQITEARALLKKSVGLPDLTINDYDFYAPHTPNREVSCFSVNRKNINTTTFNAFNHSKRVHNNILEKIYKVKKYIPFKDALIDGRMISPSGVNVIETKPGHGIMLINQSDIFDTTVVGKWVAKKEKYTKDLLKYGEVLIAKIGTLAESESFCRCVFVNEDLEGSLISSAFYRIRTTSDIPSGYVYAWLSSDYGFRLLRSTHFGTKLCYPNPILFNEYPLPLADERTMHQIDQLVKDAHSKRYLANSNEKKAISILEKEIDSWS